MRLHVPHAAGKRLTDIDRILKETVGVRAAPTPCARRRWNALFRKEHRDLRVGGARGTTLERLSNQRPVALVGLKPAIDATAIAGRRTRTRMNSPPNGTLTPDASRLCESA